MPISRGGSHLLVNLVVLCEVCHSRHHGSREFEYDMEPRIGTYGKRVALLERAIRNNDEVRFSYKKWSGEKSTRTVAPSGFEMVGNSLCVIGYCRLRSAERRFAVKRMRGAS